MKKMFVALLAAMFVGCSLLAAPAAFTAETVGEYLPMERLNSRKKVSANVKTKKYHYDNCRFYDCRDCTKFFKNAAAARRAGYVPCKKCSDFEGSTRY